jgi:hypothetical protein
VFWNVHEKKRGKFNWDFNADMMLFIETAKQYGLFVNLRIGILLYILLKIGPYVCAEWNYGGLPVWLNTIPGIEYRTMNQQWMDEMTKFVTMIARKVEPYLARNGGPIMMSQIENEMHDNRPYVTWCGKLAEKLDIQVPWVMCNGMSANNTLNACNSCNCLDDGYIARHSVFYPGTPLIFTENEGWFQNYGSVTGTRSPAELAYSVASWIAGGGGYHAYYMWHGGNHYGTGGAATVTNMYANDVNLRSDGTLNEPKYTHLGNLHMAIAAHSHIILENYATVTALAYWEKGEWVVGKLQKSYTFTSKDGVVVFLYNSALETVNVQYQDRNVTLLGKNILIVDGSFNLIFNTSDVMDKKSMQVVPVVKNLTWSAYAEVFNVARPVVGGKPMPIVVNSTPIEQLLVTEDDTPRLWYRTNATFVAGKNEITLAARRGSSMFFYVNGEAKGEWSDIAHAQGNLTAQFSFDMKTAGTYLLEIMSISFGLDNGVSAQLKEYKGIVGQVVLNGKQITNGTWLHQKGLSGEVLEIYTESGASSVKWDSDVKKYTKQELVWYRAKFDLSKDVLANAVTNPVLVTVNGFQRGHIYVNGFDIGIYWTLPGKCGESIPCCTLDRTMCDKPTQIDCKEFFKNLTI